MNELQRSMSEIKASEELKADTLRFLADQSRAERARSRFYMPACAMAVLCLFLLLGTGGYSLYGRPVSYVSIDVNPSIELGINRWGRVVSANAYNADGQQILKQVKLKNLPYAKAVRMLLEYETAENFLTENSLLVFTVISENAEAIAGKLTGLSSPLSSSVLMYTSDRACMEEAHRHEMSFGKYRAYLELSEYDGSVTLEDCHGMTMGEIQTRIEGCRGHGGGGSPYPEEDSREHCGGHRGHGGHHRGMMESN